MPTTENNIDAILDAISQDIKKQEMASQEAMEVLETLNTSYEDYKKANQKFGTSVYVAGYLGHILEDIKRDKDIMNAKLLIDYHSYIQRDKANRADGPDDISAGQKEVASILKGYFNRFFN